ncbi:hypothetical protein ONZ43_g3991 [Nemania bipapillata]|uniref:Uncharacterized protein n=1 Tax=Nemania bipapillata TaxID=110536 RepID=A0ACC2ITD7_9PEZI|nr:hypothetical protein ONZ43_g3991 [Nemania bipapillata]
MMAQNSRASQKMAQKCETVAVDMRPESSPYVSPLVTIHFADGPPLVVPARLLNKSPKLSSNCGYDTKLHLPKIPSGAGHVLVHHLFTGTYECLRPRGSSCYAKDTAEFETSVRVYAIARDYGLHDLEILARGEMEKLSPRLQTAHVLDVLKNTLPNPSVDDTWFQNYLKSMVRPLLGNPTAGLGGLPDGPSQTLSITNALLKVVIELWREKEIPPSPINEDPDAINGQLDEPDVAHVETVPTTDPESNPTPGLGSIPETEPEASDTKSQKEKKGKSKKEMKKEKKKEKKKKAESPNVIVAEGQIYTKGDKEHAEEDEGNGILNIRKKPSRKKIQRY